MKTVDDLQRRYWLFIIMDYEAEGGLDDIYETFDSLQDAIDVAMKRDEKEHGGGNTYTIFDSNARTEVKTYRRKDKHEKLSLVE